VSLQPPDENGPNCLGGEGRALHELMHALGIFHEQSRADRDDFVKISLENVIPRKYFRVIRLYRMALMWNINLHKVESREFN
jgi:Astacin (Peptidase family M12A)